MSRPPKAFGQEHTRADLIAYIRKLERELGAMDDEHQALEQELTIVRSCTDPRCQLCKSCVTAVFVKAKPMPLTLPKKYVDGAGPWRKH